MDGIIAYILSKKYVDNTVIGMGAIKGAACQVQSINKVGKTTTITLKWEDNVGGVHTQAFDIEDGLDGVSVQNATIKPNGHLELTLSDGNIIDCGKVLPQYDTMPTPSSSNEGQILQYIGTTTSNYTNGYFYECINDGGVYKWVEKSVQDSYTKGQIGSLSDLPDTSKNVIENIANIKLSVDQLSASKLSISDIDNALSDVSENPVQNKVIKLTLDQLRGSILDKLNEKEDKFRYSTMPTASVDYLNKIVEYIGATDSAYTNGYFYQCRFDGINYSWVQKNIQPSSGGTGGDGVVDGYYNSADQLFYEDSAFLNPITGEDNTIYVDLNTNGLYRYDGTIFIKVSSSTDSYTKAEIGDLSDLPDTSKNVIENIDLLNEDIDLLNGSVLNIKTDINTLQGSVINVKNDITNLQGSVLNIKTDINTLQGSLVNKVDKEAGKGLSTNDYTNDDKQKLVKLSPIYLIGSGLNLDSVTGELTASGIDVPIDTELSNTSINPVQNKVITTKIEQLEASKLSLSDVDNALSGSSINPVQNQVITLAIDQLQGSVLNKIQKMLGAQEDNFTVIDNNGGVKDSGISKNVVPTTASISNKLLVASDLSVKADKVSGAVDNDIALLDSTGNLKDSTKKLSDLQDKLTEGNGIDIDTNNKISVDISYLTASRVGYIPSSEKGAHSGVAELDSTGKVPSSQLPSYIDDVIDGYYNDTDGKFYEDSTYTTEIVGESGKIYISVDTDIQYRWTGTTFAALGGALQLGETSSTAYRGDRGKIAYDHSQIKDGSNPHNTTADNVNLKVPIPALSGSKLDVESTLYGVNNELGKKADKVASAVSGHLAGLDSNGNLTDSGVVANDVIQKVATATGLLKDDGTVDTTEYQPKTLAVPIQTLSGSQLTVETALGGINDDVVKTFTGTQAQWDALSLADKQKYEICNITDDGSTDNVYTVGEVDTLLDEKANVTAITNPNLLDNPWFTVNQRVFTTLSAAGFTYDRWRMAIDIGTVNATNNGVELDATSNPVTFYQSREVDMSIWNGVDDYTMSIDFTVEAKGSANMNFMANAQGSGHLTNFITVTPANVTVGQRYLLSGTNKLTGDISSSTSMQFAWLYLRQGWKIIIHSIKFEKGSVSTLAMDTAPNYASELLKCQRYFVRYKAPIATTLQTGMALTANGVRVPFYLPNIMRVDEPTISYSSLSDWGITQTVTASGVSPTSISRSGSAGNMQMIEFIKNGGYTASQPYMLCALNAGAYIDFSAEL